MKVRIVALLLTGGLVLGLCGCNERNGTSLPPEPVAQAEATSVPMETVEEVLPEEPEPEPEILEDSEESDGGEYVAEEEFIEQAEEAMVDVDVNGLLTAYVTEFEDYDGYQVRGTVQVSPIFTEDDMDTVCALWEELGNGVASFPSRESIYEASHQLRYVRNACSCNMLEYVIGTFELENLTTGFSIAPDNARSYIGTLKADGDGETPTLFNNDSVSVVAYSSSMKHYGDGFMVQIGNAKMESNTWGPRAFVIALPNTSTPNQPDGYRYDEIQITFIINTNGYYDPSNCATFELKYYTKEVE